MRASAGIQAHPRDTQKDHGERLHMHIPLWGGYRWFKTLDVKFVLFSCLSLNLFRYLGNMSIPPQVIKNVEAKQLDSRHNINCAVAPKP